MSNESDNLREERISLFRKVCKEHRIKVTPQRLEIFVEVMDASDHPSAEDIFTRVSRRMPTISLDTVYRTLTTFDQYGLISKVHFFEDKTRFDPNRDVHHHMVCNECKRVLDFYWPELDEADLPPQTEGWGRVDTKHLQVRGICAECLSSEQHERKSDNPREQAKEDSPNAGTMKDESPPYK